MLVYRVCHGVSQTQILSEIEDDDDRRIDVRDSLDSGGATESIFSYKPLDESEFFNLITVMQSDLVDTIDMSHGEVIYRNTGGPLCVCFVCAF